MDIIEENSEVVQNLVNTLREMVERVELAFKNSKPLLNGEQYLTNKDVCRILQVSSRTLQDHRDTGKIPFYKLEGKILYKESDILKLLEDNYYDTF